jgi:hypothetical protein
VPMRLKVLSAKTEMMKAIVEVRDIDR